MTTARKIITKALLKIGALVKTEDPAADEANDGLDSLNALIASWSNDSLNIYARTWETFNTVGNTVSYTIGTGGDFNTVRPIGIIEAYITIGDSDYDLEIIDDSTYNSLTYKSLANIPQFLSYDNAYPLGTIRLYPVPSAAYPLFLLTEKGVTEFATLDTVMSLPPGWERALIYNLAIELAPEYNQKPDPSIVGIAKESMGMIKMGVAKVRGMDAYPLRAGIGNIYNGWEAL